MMAISSARIQFILGIVLAVAAIYLALTILERLTQNVREFEELKKNAISPLPLVAGVILAVAVIIPSGVMGITAALV